MFYLQSDTFLDVAEWAVVPPSRPVRGLRAPPCLRVAVELRQGARTVLSDGPVMPGSPCAGTVPLLAPCLSDGRFCSRALR